MRFFWRPKGSAWGLSLGVWGLLFTAPIWFPIFAIRSFFGGLYVMWMLAKGTIWLLRLLAVLLWAALIWLYLQALGVAERFVRWRIAVRRRREGAPQ